MVPTHLRPAWPCPSRCLSTAAMGRRGREIGRKNRKGKKPWRVKTTSHGHGCNSASASPALPRVFLSSLSSHPLLSPSLSSAQARSKTLAHRTLPRCQLFPPQQVLSLAFSLSPGFHSFLPSSVWSRSAIAQVGQLLFFVPSPSPQAFPTRPHRASPRRRYFVLVRCTALARPTVPCLFDAQKILPGENVACVRRPSLEPLIWHQAVCTSLAWALSSALCRQSVTDTPRLGCPSVTSAFPRQ